MDFLKSWIIKTSEMSNCEIVFGTWPYTIHLFWIFWTLLDNQVSNWRPDYWNPSNETEYISTKIYIFYHLHKNLVSIISTIYLLHWWATRHYALVSLVTNQSKSTRFSLKTSLKNKWISSCLVFRCRWQMRMRWCNKSEWELKRRDGQISDRQSDHVQDVGCLHQHHGAVRAGGLRGLGRGRGPGPLLPGPRAAHSGTGHLNLELSICQSSQNIRFVWMNVGVNWK